MKIHELRFKNLNSLQGEWVIDFSAPDYAANGIFALTGPTGAGKSTILDGICLALYGATPRLGKITRSSNEIMSRQTGECYAEVFFESQAGRFRCHWEQRRARTKSSGKLQEQQHQIIDADTGKPIETKKSLVSKVIEEKTGMDFDRFTRSILLAQGGFDTFLKADDEQKSRILEQITGTEIYSAISRRVHERQRDELEKLNLLKAEASGIRLLDSGQEREILQLREQKQKEERQLTGKQKELQKTIAWLEGIEKLKNEIGSIAAEERKLDKRRDAFAPERRRLEQAVNATAVEGCYATFAALRTQRLEDQAALTRKKQTLPELEAALRKSAETLKSAEQSVTRSKKERDGAGPLLQRIRSLDQSLEEMHTHAAETEDSCTRQSALIGTNKEKLQTTTRKQKALTENLNDIQRYLSDHAEDNRLTGGLAGIEIQIAGLQQKEAARKAQEEKREEALLDLNRALKESDRYRREVDNFQSEVEDFSSRMKKEREALGDLLGERQLPEYRREKEHLLREQAFINRIIELEEHRAQLEDGSPCPLCGATEHPFAQGNVPTKTRTEKEIERLSTIIEQAETYEAAIGKITERRTRAEKNLAAAEKRLGRGEHERESAQKTSAERGANIDNITAEIEVIRNYLASNLQPLGISEITDTSGDLLDTLRQRKKTWQEQIDKKDDIGSRLKDIEAELKRLEAVLETQANVLEEQQKHLERDRKKIKILAEEREKLFDDRRVDDEEQRLILAVTQAENAEKKISAEHQTLSRQRDAVQHRIDTLTERLSQNSSAVKIAGTDFDAALKLSGFNDEQQFLAARLNPEERDALSRQAQELDGSLADLAARKKDRQNRLDEEAAQNLTTESLAELKRQAAPYEASLKRLRDEIAGCTHQLDAHNSARKQVKQKQIDIELQKKECGRWDKLHQLIGSADGKKYRTFAQGLTFELMVSHANRQLTDMSDRYLLIRDDLQPLELNVVDNYQAGEIRSTRNLSGGESFMVSLALALGLSRMASRNVRVDSLFLDEGFGTLDEEALDGALTTLSALHQENKVIGIISHVPALKDRISTQISVTPLSGGRSTISGPGCAPISHAPGT